MKKTVDSKEKVNKTKKGSKPKIQGYFLFCVGGYVREYESWNLN